MKQLRKIERMRDGVWIRTKMEFLLPHDHVRLWDKDDDPTTQREFYVTCHPECDDGIWGVECEELFEQPEKN